MRNIADKLKNLAPGDHLCCLYDTDEEHRKLLTPFLLQGIEQNQKAVYIVDARTANEVLDYLQGSDINIEQAVEKGQLWILSARESYLKNGVFDPDAMIDILRAETRRAIEEGYDALRVTGEMSWALQNSPGTDRLIEYENKLNEFFVGSRALALCQYDRRRFQPVTLLNILRTHPVAVIGTEIYDNFYYIPPAELTGETPEQRELANWIENLNENKRYEEELRRSRDELEQRVQERTNQMRSWRLSSLMPKIRNANFWQACCMMICSSSSPPSE